MKEYMARSNKDKDQKDPVLAEIENDDTPLDDKGIPQEEAPKVTVEELLAKDPSTLSASDMDILSENKDDLTDEQKVAVGLMSKEDMEGEPEKEEVEEEVKEEPKKESEEAVVETEPESEDEKNKRYKAQQVEAQIQAAKSKALIDGVNEADSLPDPTEAELKAFVAQDGATWDELTNFEQSQARRNFISERKLAVITKTIKTTQEVDEWAGRVDTFIDETDGKPEFLALSSHEADFRKYAMKEAHRGTPIDILLSAFLHNLPPAKKTRDSLFNRGGGGERVEIKEGITDADTAAQLRLSNPREYKRQVKAGKIKVEI